MAVVFVIFVSVGLAAAWYDFRPAQAEILAARGRLEQANKTSAFATPEARAKTRAQVAQANAELASARRRIGGSFALSLWRFLPGLGRQRAGLITLVDDSRRGSAAALVLLDRVQSLAEQGQLHDGVLPLDGLQQLGAEAGRAGTVFRALRHPSAGLWGSLGRARDRLNDVTASTAKSLTTASQALATTRGFLGGDGERRYLVAMENNAEMRDGGAVLSYGEIRFGDGRFQLDAHGSVTDIKLAAAASTPVPPGTQEVFGSISPTTLWQSVNATPDFAWSGQAMMDMYRQATGQTVDGVIAIDVPGLADLLRVVGPLRIPGVDQQVTAANAPQFLLHDLYEGLPPHSDQGLRKERLADVTTEVIRRLATGTHDMVGTGTALAAAAAGRHLQLWSSHSDEERAIVETGLGGGPAAVDADRTFHVAVENRTGTKLDYYVKPSVRQDVELRNDGTAVVRTTVTVDNQAPAGAPPSYALGPDEFTKEPGDYLAWLLVWGPAGAMQPASTPESGLLVSEGVATVGPGKTRALTVETTIPGAVRGGRLTLRLVPQARLDPMPLEVHLSAPGWDIVGAADWRGSWDQVRRLSWQVRR